MTNLATTFFRQLFCLLFRTAVLALTTEGGDIVPEPFENGADVPQVRENSSCLGVGELPRTAQKVRDARPT